MDLDDTLEAGVAKRLGGNLLAEVDLVRVTEWIWAGVHHPKRLQLRKTDIFAGARLKVARWRRQWILRWCR